MLINKRIFTGIGILTTSLLVSSCNSGTSASSINATIIPSEPAFAANAFEAATVVYSITFSNPFNGSVTISGMQNPFAVTKSTCSNLVYSNSCSFTLNYTPTQSVVQSLQNVVFNFGQINSQALTLTGTPRTLTLPIDTKTAFPHGLISINVGGGESAAVVFDTGSNYLVIESNYVGNNDVTLTNIKIAVDYANNNDHSGILGFAPVSYNGNSILTTANNSNSQTPIVIVPAGSLISAGTHGVMGMELNANVSTDLYLPYPYNQGFVVDFGESKVTFGLIESQILGGSAIVLESKDCGVELFTPTADVTCYADRNIPVQFTFGPNNIESVLMSIFDSGSTNTTLYMPSLPESATVDGSSKFTSTLSANLYTNNLVGESLGLTTSTSYPPEFVERPESGASPTYVDNMGYVIFYQNQIYFNPQSGIIYINQL